MANTSPTPEKESSNRLTILPSIVENFSAIAKDLIEYVKLRTGVDIVPQSETIQPTTTPIPSPTKVSEVKEEKEKPKSILGNLLSGIIKIFSPKTLIAGIAAAGIVTVLVSDMFEGFRTSFSEFTSNMWESLKEGFSNIGQWFSDLFSKGGEILSNLWDGVVDFVKPIKDRVVEFFANIGDYISEKFKSVTDFFGKFKIFGKKEQTKVLTKATTTTGVDKDGFKYTEKKAADKIIKTQEQIQYEKERDAKLEERNKKSRERLRKKLEEKKQAGTPTPLAKDEGLSEIEKRAQFSKADQLTKVTIKNSQEILNKVDSRISAQAGDTDVANQSELAMQIDFIKKVVDKFSAQDKWYSKEEWMLANIKNLENQREILRKKLIEIKSQAKTQVEIRQDILAPSPQPKAKQKITKPTQTVSGMEDTKAMIIRHEGIRNQPYKDSLGLWTVGVGHLIGDGKSLPPEMNRTFSNEEVMAMFEEDFAHHKKIAEGTPGYSEANEPGKGAFIDMAFNMGKWWPKWPGTSKALNDGNFSLAAENMENSKWYKQVGNRGPEIVNLVAQAGDGKGASIANESNQISVSKRGLSKPDTPVIVNAPTTNNNSMVNNDVTPLKRDNNKTSNSLMARI